MRTILFVFSVLLLLVSISGYILFSPQPAITNLQPDTLYDENYFVSKFAQHNIQLLRENNFTITEDELNGYINYQMQQNKLSFDKGPFKASHLDIDLLENQMFFTVYGGIYRFPVKVQSQLEPLYQNEKVYFTVKQIKFSRINIPERYYSRFMGDSLGLSNTIEKNSHFIFPLEIHQMVIVKDVEFKEDELVIQYELDKAKLMDELLKELKRRTGF